MTTDDATNMSEPHSPQPQEHVVNPQNSTGELLPSLPSSAGPAPGSAGSAAAKLSGQVHAISSGKERASSAGSVGSRRQSGPLTAIHLQPVAPSLNDGPAVNQANAKLPPLTHGYGTTPNGTGLLRTTPLSAGSGSLHQHQLYMEPLQPVSQQAVMLPGPIPAAHPYQPKRKPPSAFMRNNPMRQQLEANSHPHRTGSAGSHRSYAAAYDAIYAMPPDAGTAGSETGPALDPVQQQHLQAMQQQQQQFADEVIAAAQAAIVQGQQPHSQQAGWGGMDGGAAAPGGFSAVPPWGVSSVSDLEALDSILDQLVVVDARMRKALLKGPLISFETVVPEHIMNAARGYVPHQQQQPQQQRSEEEKDRTFMTTVKGMAVEDGAEATAEVVEAQVAAGAPPPSPAPREGNVAAAQQATRPTRSTDDNATPPDSSLFPASIPNPGMHPTFTRAYLTSKLTPKPQNLPPPAPATADHLLRSRPPPFIAAPSYDQLCSQIRDVQRQYTCGTARQAGAQPAGAAALLGALAAAAPSAANQYIAGLDGPTLEEVVTQQELPISLERVRPTFVALKQKGVRGPSPRRRPGSPGRGVALGSAEGAAE